MEKLKVSKEVFDSLNTAKRFYPKNIFLAMHGENILNNKIFKDKDFSCINSLSMEEMARALYVGYELEESKEEFISRIYKFYKEENTIESNKSFSNGILFTLNTLEIKIEGIN